MSTLHHDARLKLYSASVKAFAIATLLLSLGACASSGKGSQGAATPPLEISYAPAIDVSYEEVVNRLKAHIGVKVRWGGQIVGSQDIDGLTRLTVIAYPLNAQGRPDRKVSNDFAAGRFIVESKNFNPSKEGRFMTVYGPVSGEQLLTNGKLERLIPVITAIESKEWNDADLKYIARTGRHLPYNGLGFGYNFGFGHGFYANSSSGFYNHHPYGYYGRFRSSNLGHGLRISRRGRHN